MRFATLTSALALALASAHVAGAACTTGAPIPAPPAAGSVILPPAITQPTGSQLPGMVLQYRSGSDQVTSFGMVFPQGAVTSSTHLRWVMQYEGAKPLQIDPKSFWPDGSVKFAVATAHTFLCVGTQDGGPLDKLGPLNPPITLTAPTLTVAITFSGGNYSGTKTVDLGAALQAAINAGTVDYWRQGTYAAEARVEVPVTGGTPNTLRITADITKTVDAFIADVQFNNDLATISTSGQGAALAPLAYTATITLAAAGQTTNVTNWTIPAQYQYQDWHAQISTRGKAPYVAGPSGPAVNVLRDLAGMEKAGAVLSYDRTMGVTNGYVTGPNENVFDRLNAAQSGMGVPLSSNGVEPNMPIVGGRPDIGYTNEYATTWLLTSDVRAANVGLAWGDTGGAVPWNYRMSSGHWLTPADNSQVWTDTRGTVTLANGVNGAAGWTPEAAHMPNLAYVPYLMTGTRWYLDRLNAQAAFSIVSLAPDAQYGRCIVATCDLVMHPGSQQLRGMAWSMREIGEAANTGPADVSGTYFRSVMAHNWSDAASQESALSAVEGEPTGWWPRIYDSAGHYGPWEQDYMTGTMALLAGLGETSAKGFVGWQKPGWLTGRFSTAHGWNPYDGCTGTIVMYNPPGTLLTTWAGVEAATVANGSSNGSGWQSFNNGDFCALGRAAMGVGLTLYPGDTGLTAGLNWLNANGPAYIQPQYFNNDPTFMVVPIQP